MSKCSLCEGTNRSEATEKPSGNNDDVKNGAIKALGQIIKSVDLHDNRRPRVLAMFTLRRFATHFNEPDFLNFEVSPFAQWCLKSLSSSNRELRIAAGYSCSSLTQTSPALT